MINLVAENDSERIVKDYLDKNASTELRNKINNGSKIEKDNVFLLNKKTLQGFMKFAKEEARKLVDKNTSSACIDDKTMFGWAIHYFEEDTIHENLFNLDGSEYKNTKSSNLPISKPIVKPTKKADKQFSLFDVLENTDKNDKEDETEIIEEVITDEITNEDYEDAFQQQEQEEKDKNVENKIIIPEKKVEKEFKPTKFYETYMNVEFEYPDYIICWRLGDFYEILGHKAKKASEILDLTLTGRECGLPARVPMVGFPYHRAEEFFNILSKTFKVAILENDKISLWTEQNIDYDTGEVISSKPVKNNDVIAVLEKIFKSEAEIRL